MCGGSDSKRVDCCAILNDWPTKEQAITAWNSRNTPPENASSEIFAVVKSVAECDSYPRYKELKEIARKVLKEIAEAQS